jgi:hypothetical protein
MPVSIGNNKAADARVERALYQRAVGYSYETIQTKVCDNIFTGKRAFSMLRPSFIRRLFRMCLPGSFQVGCGSVSDRSCIARTALAEIAPLVRALTS